jgi:hypothetical protein
MLGSSRRCCATATAIPTRAATPSLLPLLLLLLLVLPSPLAAHQLCLLLLLLLCHLLLLLLLCRCSPRLPLCRRQHLLLPRLPLRRRPLRFQLSVRDAVQGRQPLLAHGPHESRQCAASCAAQRLLRCRPVDGVVAAPQPLVPPVGREYVRRTGGRALVLVGTVPTRDLLRARRRRLAVNVARGLLVLVLVLALQEELPQ